MHISPRDDLFRHVNGQWLLTHEIPADRGRDGAFHALIDAAELHVREIVEDCAAGRISGDNAAKIGATFGSFMDTDRIEALGMAPLEADIAPIRDAESPRELARAMGALAVAGVDGLIEWDVSNDPNDPERYTMFVAQGGLGLPDEAYYREDAHGPIREKYVTCLARLMEIAGVSGDPEGDAARILTFETAVAGGHWDQVTVRDADKTNNPMNFEQLAELASGFDLDAWAEGTGTPEAFEKLAVMTPPFFAALGELWRSTDLAQLKTWALAHVVLSRAPYLTDDAVQARFDFYGTALTGATQIRDRWKRGVGLVDAGLAEAVGELYVARHFPPEAKARMDRLVAKLVEAYRESVGELDWMGKETKKNALAKLEGFLPKIGYPEKWRDYSALTVDAADLVGNVRAISAHEVAYQVGKLGTPVDRSEWLMPPQMVNAYYMPTTNEIAFPAAILQPPFFGMDADDADNYGGIGAVIGHEIGHGFDDQGSKYDATGALRTWWTDEDRTAFDERTRALIDQYGGLTPAQLGDDSAHHVNGELTVGENIGDLGGLSIALRAYRLELAERGSDFASEPEIDGHTALQRYFLNWARVWREKGRDEDIVRLLSIDPHSPAEFRCNQTAKNVPEFHEAFGVEQGDGMWLAPEDRVKIW